MEITEKHTRVLIVGAWPSGLMMAAQLLRYGIQPLIIDRKQGPTKQSNALAVQARSLEIYRQMGIEKKVVEEGRHSNGLFFHYEGKQAAAFPINDAGEGSTPFPYVQIYQQNKNERVLLDNLTRNCCPVYWNTALADLTQNGPQTTAVLTTANSECTITCDWIIGTDGAHSALRKHLQVPFSGDTYPHRYFLADITLNDPLDQGYINLFLSEKGFTGFFPLPEENGYRLIGTLPDKLSDNGQLQIEDVLPFASKLSGFQIDIKACDWFTTYKLHHRVAEKFRLNNCFLIGDAAHIHSPVGGQGMNTGLQDAYNLAWKLAAVINGQIETTILDTYEQERMMVAKDLLKTTDRAFNLIMSKNIFVSFFKKHLLAQLLNWLWSKENIRKRFFSIVSQIAINYRSSRLSLHLSHATTVKAGDRLPYLKIFDEKKHEETDLHAWCAKPGFTLLAFGKLQDFDLFAIAKWITQQYAQIVNFYYLPPSPKNQQVFDAFEIKEGQQKAIIVRPDMYIGFINDWIDMEKMDNYLKNVVGVNSQGG